MADDLVLKVEDVSKTYPGVKALQHISIEIRKGEVRALVGENGAGKSTLIKCIMGVEHPDSGTISINVNGEWKNPKSVIESKACGMQANYQHVNIAPELSIAENYFMGQLPKTRMGIVDWGKMVADSRVILDKFQMDVNPRAKINDLSIAMQQMVTISKISVDKNLRLVIFDEPTALLEDDKVQILFNYIRELKEQGISVIYISHRLEEVTDICDTVTIFKDGQYVDTKNVSEVTKDTLVPLMVGRDVGDLYAIEHREPGEEMLAVENLCSGKLFQNVSFKLHAGEILGFSGLVGAGRSEVMRAIFGVEKLDSGTIKIRGKEVQIKNPMQAMRLGIGFLTENRRHDGLAMPLSVKINTNMYSYDMISKAGLISLQKEKERAAHFKEEIDIKTPTLEQHVENLSGGNQQKVVIAKLLCRDPDILIFDEPTVGVDVGAKQEIYKLMEQLTAQGKAIILISSYLPEVMGLSDRLVVMSEGKVAGTLDNKELKTAEESYILKLAATYES